MSRKPDDEKPAISVWMARARNDLGVSVDAIAGEAGYSVSALRKVEGGSNPTPSRALVAAVFGVLRRLGAEKGVAVVDPPGAASRERPAELGGLLEAMAGQTAAISSLAEAIARRTVGAAETAASYDVDEATKRRRREYWIARALEESKMTRPKLRQAVDLPAGRDQTLARWLAGDLPKGAQLERFAQALMLPLHVLEEPPRTDPERLVELRQEAITELLQPEPARPRQERERRSA